MDNATIPLKTLSIKEQAAREVAEEKSKKAKEALKVLLRRKDAADLVSSNIEREIADCERAIEEGSFAG